MQIALIAPKSMLEWTRLGDMHFIIPQTADVGFYREEDKYKLLDNGTYESGRPMPVREYLALASTLYVDEIIIPDVLFNLKETFYNAKKFFANHSFFPAKKMIVPQGENPAEFIQAYQLFVSTFPKADIIGIPKWLDGKFHCRAAVLHYLAEHDMLANKPHHLLGVDSLTDLRLCQLIGEGFIRSCDTSKPFTYAYANKALSLWSQEDIERVRFDAPPLVGAQRLKLLDFNILKLKEAVNWNNST